MNPSLLGAEPGPTWPISLADLRNDVTIGILKQRHHGVYNSLRSNLFPRRHVGEVNMVA